MDVEAAQIAIDARSRARSLRRRRVAGVLLGAFLVSSVLFLVWPPEMLPSTMPPGWQPPGAPVQATWLSSGPIPPNTPSLTGQPWQLAECSEGPPYVGALVDRFGVIHYLDPGHEANCAPVTSRAAYPPNSELELEAVPAIRAQDIRFVLTTGVPLLQQMQQTVWRAQLSFEQVNAFNAANQRQKVGAVNLRLTGTQGVETRTLGGDLLETLQVGDGMGLWVYEVGTDRLFVIQAIQELDPAGAHPAGILRFGVLGPTSTEVEWAGWLDLPEIRQDQKANEPPRFHWILVYAVENMLYLGLSAQDYNNPGPSIGPWNYYFFWTSFAAPPGLTLPSKTEPLRLRMIY